MTRQESVCCQSKVRTVRSVLARGVSISMFVLGVLACTRPVAAQTSGTSAAPQTPAASTASQEPADPNPGAFTLTGGTDFVNRYMFRGIRQNSTGIAIWPWADLGIAAYSGEGGLKSVGINVGTWNSLNTSSTVPITRSASSALPASRQCRSARRRSSVPGMSTVARSSRSSVTPRSSSTAATAPR